MCVGLHSHRETHLTRHTALARAQAVARAWLPLSAAVLGCVVRVIPSPVEAQVSAGGPRGVQGVPGTAQPLRVPLAGHARRSPLAAAAARLHRDSRCLHRRRCCSSRCTRGGRSGPHSPAVPLDDARAAPRARAPRHCGLRHEPRRRVRRTMGVHTCLRCSHPTPHRPTQVRRLRLKDVCSADLLPAGLRRRFREYWHPCRRGGRIWGPPRLPCRAPSLPRLCVVGHARGRLPFIAGPARRELHARRGGCGGAAAPAAAATGCRSRRRRCCGWHRCRQPRRCCCSCGRGRGRSGGCGSGGDTWVRG